MSRKIGRKANLYGNGNSPCLLLRSNSVLLYCLAMIDKRDFYHGVAALRVIEDPRCQSIIRDTFGYAVNGDKFFVVKYASKSRSPWTFSITKDEFSQLQKLSCDVAVVFVCAADVICAVPWKVIFEFLGMEIIW